MELILDFERPVIELYKRIDSLKALERDEGIDLSAAIHQLQEQAARLHEQVFSALTPWQRAQLARHPRRPYTMDYVNALFTDYDELHGDRAGHEDYSIIGGMARYKGHPVAVIGHQKGRNTKENIRRNFGMPRPEGYRKALRIMKFAERFDRPIITFIDTPGAFPGIDAEARGQAEAIARNIMEMAALTVPVICVVIGEGGSGGALAVGVGNRVLMLQNSIYSVISPEGCAAILWRDRAEGPRAAEALRITAEDCLRFGVADEIIDEPAGGAHRDHEEAIANLDEALSRHFEAMLELDPTSARSHRHDRFRVLGELHDPASNGAMVRH